MKAIINIKIILLFLWPGILFGQQLISGMVISDKDNQPLPGAYISGKQSKVATVTKADGSFFLTISVPNDTILVRYIGFQTKILTPPYSSPLSVRLVEDLQSLKEVRITTGYYELPKERTTGSFSVVPNEALNQNAGADILSRLKGVANGLLIDERSSGSRKLNVRGLSTLYSETEPLIVLNNFPFDGDINSINPDDVESVTILKDAAAASIWGVRAANGVIVIKTKYAALNSPTKVSLNSNVSFGREPDMYYRRSISSADFIEVEKMLFQKGFYTKDENDPSNPPLTPVVEVLIASRDGLISPAEANSRIEKLKSLDVRRDFQKYLYENSLSQQYTATLMGGGAKNTWFYSAGYNSNTDFTGGRWSRLSLRGDNMFQVSPKLKITPSVSFTRQEDQQGKPNFTEIKSGSLEELYPYAQLADENGNPLPVIKNYRFGYASDLASKGLESLLYIPLADFRTNQNTGEDQELLISLETEYKINRAFSGKVAYQYDRNWREAASNYSQESFYVREMVNMFAQEDATGAISFPLPKGGILDQFDDALNSHTGRGQLNYNLEEGKHSIAALAGGEIRHVGQKSEQYRTYGFDESGLISSPVDYTTVYNFYTTNNSGGIPYNNSFTEQINRYTALYMNGAYTYDDRYSFSASARKDASNLFGVNSNMKGVPLWSVGGAWNLHNEGFFKIGLLEYLRVRTTYGYNGNLSRNLSALATVSQVSANRNSMPYGIIKTFPNPDLSWEKVANLNTGIDFRTRNNRVTGSIEFYRKHGQNLIGDQTIDPTVGILSGTVRRNVASMKASGVDLQVSTENINRALKWGSGFIFNWYKDKVTAIEESERSASSYISFGTAIKPFLGKPLRSVITYKWNGLDPATGNPTGIFQGESSQAYSNIVFNSKLEELDHHGSAVPTIFGSFSNTFSYRNFSLYLNLAYRLGYSFIRPSISYTMLFNNWRGDDDFSRRWQKPGDELFTQVPSMVYPASSSRDQFYTNSSALVEKGDNLRLQDVNVSYNLQRLGNIPVKQLRLYTFLTNPGFLWRANKLGLDPDYSGSLPVTPSISFGLKANF